MCHENTAPEIGFGEHVGERGCMIDVKTVVMSVLVQCTRISALNANVKSCLWDQDMHLGWDNILY